MGYSRQDRIESLSDAFSARIVAQMLSLSFINRLFIVDLHASQSLGFFSIPSLNLNVDEFIVKDIVNKYNLDDIVLISPDTGNVKSIITIANKINVEYSIAIKYRPQANENRILSMVGYDITDKICIIIDDIVDSAGTICNVAEKIAKRGAKDIIAYITHPVLSGKAIDRINNSHLTKLFVSDSIDLKEKASASRKIQEFSIADWCLEQISYYTKGL
jgi:ribose-phosphate pyrophosphokinase